MELKHHKGKWTASESRNGEYKTQVKSGDIQICSCQSIHLDNATSEANAILIADAGTTSSKCNLLPSQLLDQRNELLKACMRFVEKVETGRARSTESYNEMKKAIKNAIP